MSKTAKRKIYVLGYPKSGTTWLSRLLGDALNSPVGAVRPVSDGKAIATEGQGRPGPYYIRQGHAVPVEHGDTLTPGRHEFSYKHLRGERVVIMLRDPRDVAVSAAHHWNRDLTTILHCMGRGEWPIPHGGGWVRWIKSWMQMALPPAELCMCSYENLSHQAVGVLSNLCSWIGVASDELHKIVERQSFAARRAWTEKHGDRLNYGKAFQLRFLRKGIVGDWRNHFTSEHKRLAEEYFGDTMRELEYVKSEGWMNE